MTTETVKTECPQPDPVAEMLLHHELVRRSGRGWNQTGDEAAIAGEWVQAGGPVKTVHGLNAGPWWLSWWAFAELEYRTLLVNTVPHRNYYAEFTYRQTRKLPEEWAAEDGIMIHDPDGWRNAGKDFREPVTRAEFDELLPPCTIGPLLSQAVA